MLEFHDIEEMLDGTGIEFRCGRVDEVDPEAQSIRLADTSRVRYDILICALGSAAAAAAAATWSIGSSPRPVVATSTH